MHFISPVNLILKIGDLLKTEGGVSGMATGFALAVFIFLTAYTLGWVFLPTRDIINSQKELAEARTASAIPSFYITENVAVNACSC